MRPAEPESIVKLAPVRVNVVTMKAPVVGRVSASTICTRSRKAAGFVRHVEIDVSGTALAGSFQAGQAFGVLPPGLDERGKPHKLRLYSIASPSCGEDGQGNVLATTVKRLIDEHHEDHRLFCGTASNYLCDLQVGDEILVTGPSGKRFLLPENPADHDFVFFATGTGIAPFRGMILELTDKYPTSKVVLVMGSPYTTDLLYDDDLRALSETHPQLTYLTAISRETGPDGDGHIYVHERVRTHRSLLEPMLHSRRTLVYVCGIAGMEVSILGALADVLPPSALGLFATVSVEAGPRSGWNRKMIGRSIKPTSRLMLEVY